MKPRLVYEAPESPDDELGVIFIGAHVETYENVYYAVAVYSRMVVSRSALPIGILGKSWDTCTCELWEIASRKRVHRWQDIVYEGDCEDTAQDACEGIAAAYR